MAQVMDQSESPGPGAGPERWKNLQCLLCRGSPLAHPDFEPSPDTLGFVQATCKIIVIGAGGLGCELLKDLALLGFTQIHCIDMDTIDLSNLNRQFLFRPSDIGKPKSIVAAEFINKRISGCCVVPHYCKIQDYGPDFYQQFHLIVCGLDSITARRWINGMALSLLRYEDDELDQSSIIPVIDGGTEGFKGNARVILPGITACFDCTLDLYPPQVSYPLCTIATKPRLPEHCIEYVRVLLWSKEKPFSGATIDGDNPDHMLWIYEKAQERAEEYGIQGVNYRLTQGVVKNIIPAVASTNAVIAAACATEAFKLATSCSKPLQNYMVFNDTDGVYTYTFECERKEDCFSCSTRPVSVAFSSDAKLKDLYDHLVENQTFSMKSPSLTTVVDGRNKTLYMPTLEAMKKVTEANLSKTLHELGIDDGHQIVVADVTTPKPVTLSIKYIYNME